MEEKETVTKEKNKKITSKFEIFIGIVAFLTLAAQSLIFYFEYRGKDWLSSFGDYFGFSAAFLSALVIVLLIRELKEQRESRVKLEESFDDNAKTLGAVKEFFESQADYQNTQVEFLEQQKNNIEIENITRKYESHIKNILFFKTEHQKILFKTQGNFQHLINLLHNCINKESVHASDIYAVFNSDIYKLAQYMMYILITLDSLKKDIETLIEGNFDALISSELDIILIDKLKKNELLVLLNYLININSILDIEEKYTFLIYNTYYNRTNKSDYTMLDTLLLDDLRILWDNKISFKNLSNSNFKLKDRANNIINTLETIEIILE